LKKFEALTKFVFTQTPQIINSLAVYYQLHNILLDIKEKKDDFQHISDDIAKALEDSFEKYQKYYIVMDNSDIYYIASTLDPRIKTSWIKVNLSETDSEAVVKQIISHLNIEYTPEKSLEVESTELHSSDESDFEMAILTYVEQKSSTMSDIELYFNIPTVQCNRSATSSKERSIRFQWTLNWWGQSQET
jgi:hypothetical protein